MEIFTTCADDGDGDGIPLVIIMKPNEFVVGSHFACMLTLNDVDG